MASTVVFNRNNVPAPPAPPTYYISDNATPANGSPVPPGFSSWRLDIDTTGLPAGQLLGDIGLEYQRLAAWTDKANVVHPAGEWLNDVSAPLVTGLIAGSLIRHVGSTIGARDANGNMVEPYPDNFRFRVDQCPGYASLPNVKLTLFS